MAKKNETKDEPTNQPIRRFPEFPQLVEAQVIQFIDDIATAMCAPDLTHWRTFFKKWDHARAIVGRHVAKFDSMRRARERAEAREKAAKK